ncbi:MAG: response regulator [Desulfobacterota bacterium]|nr:response regulator [Thermodesulfobacteriota bacterium]
MIQTIGAYQDRMASEERLKNLEVQNRWMVEALEWMVSLSEVMVGFAPDQGPTKIFNTARLYLKRLIPFQCLSFLTVNEEDFDFTIAFCEPEADRPLLQREIEGQIAKGHFAWALQQNRNLTVPADQFEANLLLHPLVTRTSVVGLFAGVLSRGKEYLSDVESNLLTLVLYNTAQGLENALLYQKINEQNRNLERIVQKRTEELQHALELAKEASVAKGMFLANMSHEIRTPLNAVVGYTEMLLETGLNEEQFDYAMTIRSSGEALLALIDDILDFSKIEAGQLRLERIDFDPEMVIYEVCKMVCPKIGRKPVELLCRIGEDLPTFVKGDPHRFRQVLLNLVGNAAKFTDAGEIEVAIHPEAEEADRLKLHVRVRDTGIGISKEKLGVIFDLFQQADGSTTRKYGGTGLGLAICKQISRAMGGDVWAESEPGQGSLFHFTAWVEKSEGAKVRRFTSPSLSNRRVLLIDPHQTRRELIETVLRGAGVEVISSEDGQELGSDSFSSIDLCLLDADHPSGFRMARKIRGAGWTTIPLLSITPPLEQNAQRFKEEGFLGFLNRPLRRDRLFEILLRFLKEEKPTKEPAGIQNRREEPLTAHLPRRIRVLLAEDNPVNQRMMVKMLDKLGCHVDTVVNGIEAIRRVEQSTYDLVLMDCQMPEMDGYTATAEIRRRGGTFLEIPIIAVTAHALAEDRDRCIKAGMNDYLSKPVQKEVLVETIRKWVRD